MINFLVLLILSVVHFSLYGQNFQSKILFKATTYNLYSISQSSNSSVWAIGTPHWDQNSLSYQSTVLFSNDLGTTWEEKDVVSGKFTSVFFSINKHGWICGEKGLILKTTDNGNNWSSTILDENFDIQNIFFTNTTTGYAVGHNSQTARVWKTEDGGVNWQTQLLPLQLTQLNSVKFADSQKGWICGSYSLSGNNYGIILCTKDGGVNWDVQFNEPEELTFTTLFFADPEYGWAAGFNTANSSGSTIFKTSDGGNSWTPLATEHKIYSLHFIDRLRGLAGGIPANSANGPKLLRTIDGGQSWDELTVKPHTGEIIYGLWADQNHFIAVGNRSFVCTGSQPWGNINIEPRHIQNRFSFNSIFFKDNNTGWVAGTKPWFDHGNQIIMRTEDGGKNWSTVYERDTICDVYARLFSRVRDIAVFDDNSGIAVGDIKSHPCDPLSATVLTTVDGGRNWQIMQNMRDSIYAFHAMDKNNIWLIPQINNGLLHLWNGNPGSLQKKEYGLQVNFSGQGDVFFLDAMRGWIAGGKGTVAATNDGGASWQMANNGVSSSSTCQTIWFTEELKGWIGGSDLYQTSDGGKTWVKRDDVQFNPNEIFDIKFTDINNGWLARDKDIIMRTCNGGQTWIEEKGRKNFQRIRAIHFIDDSTGWGCGDDGTIVSIRGTTSNSIVNKFKHKVPAFAIKSLKHGIHVSFDSPKKDIAFLELIDLHGRRLTRIIKSVSPGKNIISIPTQKKGPGVYIVKYVCSDYSLANKITIQ